MKIYHMGTARKEGKLVTAGGRVLMAVAEGDTVAAARDKVYEAVGRIRCENLFYRNDIAHCALNKED